MQNSWSYIRMRLDLLQEKADAKRKEALHMGCLDGIYEVLNSFKIVLNHFVTLHCAEPKM